VHAYDLLPDGSLRYRKELITFTERWGDGMTVDSEGNLYVAVSALAAKNNGIYVFSPEGKQLAMLPTPEDAINADFGRGTDSNVLYVACEHGLYRIRLLHSGYRPASK
jgi:gluconolactonase